MRIVVWLARFVSGSKRECSQLGGQHLAAVGNADGADDVDSNHSASHAVGLEQSAKDHGSGFAVVE
jgi:hypothetical protein